MIVKDLEELSIMAAKKILAVAESAIEARCDFSVALAGGSTPEGAYRVLARAAKTSRVDWNRVQVFFGDERLVPYDDSRSNFGMACRSLLDHVSIPPDRIHPIPTSQSPAECAKQYELTIKKFVTDTTAGGEPRFDLVLLGLGDDGHTASLFPHRPAVKETERLVTWSPPGRLPPPVDRVTLTLSAINSARHVMFLVAGEGKAQVVREILEGNPAIEDYPAAGVRPEDGDLLWLIDDAAGKLLKGPQGSRGR